MPISCFSPLTPRLPFSFRYAPLLPHFHYFTCHDSPLPRHILMLPLRLFRHAAATSIIFSDYCALMPCRCHYADAIFRHYLFAAAYFDISPPFSLPFRHAADAIFATPFSSFSLPLRHFAISFFDYCYFADAYAILIIADFRCCFRFSFMLMLFRHAFIAFRRHAAGLSRHFLHYWYFLSLSRFHISFRHYYYFDLIFSPFRYWVFSRLPAITISFFSCHFAAAWYAASFRLMPFRHYAFAISVSITLRYFDLD